MKKLLALLALASVSSCVVNAQHATSCSYTVLSGTRITDLTLNANTIYELQGCYKVTNGAKLTIPPGTVIIAQKSSGAGLYIAPGAKIDAQGTATNPVVFTSDQAPGFRTAGDWDGILIGGNASNNASGGYIQIDRSCAADASANNNDADNSGTLQYVQIHYAKTGLIAASTGSGTVLDHIQVTESSENSFAMRGGTANIRYAVSVNPRKNDFYLSDGYRGNMQFLLAWRPDANAHTSQARSVYIVNNEAATTTTPLTRPVISNMTILGPAFCNSGPLSADFLDGVAFNKEGRGAVYNSVVTGWPDYGLNLIDAGSILATSGNDVQFSYNSFGPNGLADDMSGTWSSACQTTRALWLDGGTLPCAEAGNQFSGPSYTIGYSTAICSSTTPDFRLGTSGLDVPDYSGSDLGSAFFNTSITTRGAFDGSTNWVANWSQFDAQNINYCPPQPRAAPGKASPAQVVLAPNPTTGTATVEFNASVSGKARISILDNTSGQALQAITAEVPAAGSQRVIINVSGLRTGSYVVRVELAGQAPAYGHLMIK